METFSALLALCTGNSPVNGEFPSQRSVMQSFDVFFDLCLNKWMSKQSWNWWFEMPWCSLWCHCNDSYGWTHWWAPGAWINIKIPSYQYRKSHCGDKTILRPSYLHNGISNTGKMLSLYWIRALVSDHIWIQSIPVHPEIAAKASIWLMGNIRFPIQLCIQRWNKCHIWQQKIQIFLFKLCLNCHILTTHNV